MVAAIEGILGNGTLCNLLLDLTNNFPESFISLSVLVFLSRMVLTYVILQALLFLNVT